MGHGAIKKETTSQNSNISPKCFVPQKREDGRKAKGRKHANTKTSLGPKIPKGNKNYTIMTFPSPLPLPFSAIFRQPLLCSTNEIACSISIKWLPLSLSPLRTRFVWPSGVNESHSKLMVGRFSSSKKTVTRLHSKFFYRCNDDMTKEERKM